MARIRTLIVDDEPLAREGIKVLVDKDPEFEVIGECSNGADAVAAIRSDNPDLLFLDMHMPRMNGIEVLKRIDPRRAPVVVFVTAFDRYALEAFEHHALDYLLKPFDDERFERTLSRVKIQIRQQTAEQLGQRMAELLDRLEGGGGPASPRHLTRLSIKSAGRIFFVNVDEIDWIEAADYYVKLHIGGKSHLLRESMQRLSERLDPARFMRIHRSAIVNLDRITELRSRPHGDYAVCLDDGTRIRLGRGRKDKLSRLLEARAGAAGSSR